MSTFVFDPATPVSIGDQRRFQDLSTLAQAVVQVGVSRCFAATIDNLTGPAKFFQLHNTAAAIVPGAVPILTIRVPANSLVILGNDFFGPPMPALPLVGGLFFSVGLAWGWSTTENTFTAAPAASQVTQILYV